MNKSIAILAATSVAAFGAAQTKTFVVGDEKFAYRNVIQFESGADYEAMVGTSKAAVGNIVFNPTTHVGSGKISVPVKSIDTGIPLRNDHMNSEGWLNSGAHPNITFDATSVKHVKGDHYTVKGSFTLHGVTKAIIVPVTLQYKAASAQTKAAGFPGDVVKLSASFGIKLSDYKVSNPAISSGKVSNDVTIRISAYGIAQ